MNLDTYMRNLVLRARKPEALTRRLFLLETREDLESRMKLQRLSSRGRRHVGKFQQAVKNIDRLLKQCPAENTDPLPEPIEGAYQEWLAKVPDPKLLEVAEAYMARKLESERAD